MLQGQRGKAALARFTQADYRAIPETVRQNQARAATNDAPLLTMQDNATDLRGAIIPDCGHFVVEENPEALLAHLLPFLLEQDGPDGSVQGSPA